MKTPAKFTAGIFLVLVVFFAACQADRQNDPATSATLSSAADAGHPETMSVSADKTEPVKDLVCGMTVDPSSPSVLKTQYKGQTYYFCSDICKKSFEANPEKYIPQKATGAKADKAKDPVCGMDVDPNSPDVLKTQYKGQTYYFCAEMCKKTFEANPEKYVHKVADPGMHGVQMTE